MKKRQPFSDEAKRNDLRDRLNAIQGVDISPDGIEKWPNFPLTAVNDDAAMQQFLDTLDWYVSEVRAT